MSLRSIERIAVSGQVLEFTARDGTRFRVEGYVADESDGRPGAVRCPTERCGAQCCAEGGYCGDPRYMPRGAKSGSAPVQIGARTVVAHKCTGRCPALSVDLKCEIHSAKPIGGWLFPVTPTDHEAYPLCELRCVEIEDE